MQAQTNVQIGKNGFTEGFAELLKNAFKNHDTVRVSLLKTSTRDRQQAKEIGEKICLALGKRYTYKILGFTLFIKKWRKPRVSKRKKKQ